MEPLLDAAGVHGEPLLWTCRPVGAGLVAPALALRVGDAVLTWQADARPERDADRLAADVRAAALVAGVAVLTSEPEPAEPELVEPELELEPSRDQAGRCPLCDDVALRIQVSAGWASICVACAADILSPPAGGAPGQSVTGGGAA